MRNIDYILFDFLSFFIIAAGVTEWYGVAGSIPHLELYPIIGVLILTFIKNFYPLSRAGKWLLTKVPSIKRAIIRFVIWIILIGIGIVLMTIKCKLFVCHS